MEHTENLNKTIDYSEVYFDSELGFTEDDRDQVIDWIIGQVERATNKKVISVDGDVSESDHDLYMELTNGDKVTSYYKYSPYRNKEREEGIVYVTYTDYNTGKEYEMNETELDEDDIHDGEVDFAIVKEILSKYINCKVVIELPKEHLKMAKVQIGDTGYHYDANSGHMEIKVEFESNEKAEAWIDSLYDKIIKPKQR